MADLRLLACVPGTVETQSTKGTRKYCSWDGNLSHGKGRKDKMHMGKRVGGRGRDCKTIEKEGD